MKYDVQGPIQSEKQDHLHNLYLYDSILELALPIDVFVKNEKVFIILQAKDGLFSFAKFGKVHAESSVLKLLLIVLALRHLCNLPILKVSN